MVFFLVNKIGYKTETDRLAKATRLTFFATLINSTLIPILSTANLTEQGINFGQNSLFYDFNMKWFKLTGNVILHAQIFNITLPIIIFFVMASIRKFNRLSDRSWTLDKYKTKTKTITAYINLYSGPEFLLHFKYNALLVDVFVTMTFGFGMPLLFPICVVSFCVRYVLDTACLHYSFRAPPSYDKEIASQVYSLLLLAPAFYLSFAYWMSSNLQLSSNAFLKPII